MLVINLPPPQGRLLCTIFTKSAAFVTFGGETTKLIVFSSGGGIFPQIFSSPAAKLLIGSKKLGGCKNGTDLPYHRAKYGGDRGSRAG